MTVVVFRILMQRNCCAPLNAVDGLRKELHYELENGVVKLQVTVDPTCEPASFELVCDWDGDLLFSGVQERKWPRPGMAAGLIRNHLKRVVHIISDDKKNVTEEVEDHAGGETDYKRCVPCESGDHPVVVPLTKDEIERFFAALTKRQQGSSPATGGKVTAATGTGPVWRLTDGAGRLQCQWTAPSFAEAMDFIQLVGHLAEAEQHHPDIHLTGYNNVTLDLWTHVSDCLTEIDFILATKINLLSFFQTEVVAQPPAE